MLSDDQQSTLKELIGQARERIDGEIRSLSEDLQKLEGALKQLGERQISLEQGFDGHLDALSKIASEPSSDLAMEGLFGGVRNLTTATMPDQVLEVLTEEAEQLGVRAAVFDVRGRAAWGSSARGFGSEFSVKAFRSLIVPLTQENAFRQVYETGADVEGGVEKLKKNRNVMDRFRPGTTDNLLLLPVRSAGSVAAIFYADTGDKKSKLPVHALKILAEFAGAQLDRLMALSGGVPEEDKEQRHGAAPEPQPEPPPPAVQVKQVEEVSSEPVVSVSPSVPSDENPIPEATTELEPWEVAIMTEKESRETQIGLKMASLVSAISPATPAESTNSSPEVTAVASAPTTSAPTDLSTLTDADQKVHKDARRFAKLLISEIELYNKTKVSEGRRNKDLYRRLRLDIDRSRQTYDKRFASTVAKDFDYFHDELVKTLASSDPSNLGPDYPGSPR